MFGKTKSQTNRNKSGLISVKTIFKETISDLGEIPLDIEFFFMKKLLFKMHICRYYRCFPQHIPTFLWSLRTSVLAWMESQHSSVRPVVILPRQCLDQGRKSGADVCRNNARSDVCQRRWNTHHSGKHPLIQYNKIE